MNKRLNYIDQLKGFAMLLVVMGHVYVFCLGTSPFIGKIIGSFHMPLFFFLSGIVYNPQSASLSSFSAFFRNKVLRIMLPFIFISPIAAAYRDYDLGYYALNIYKAGYWYLLILTYLNIILYTYQTISNHIKSHQIIFDSIFIIFFVLILEIIRYWLPIRINQLLSYDFVCLYFIPFFTGVLVKKYQLVEKIFSNNLYFTISLLLFFLAFSINNTWNLGFYAKLITGLTAIIPLGYLFFTALPKNNYIMNRLSEIGQKSLEIYVFHVFFIFAMPMNDFGSYCESTGNSMFEFIVCVLLSVIITYMSIFVGYLLCQSKFLAHIIFLKK